MVRDTVTLDPYRPQLNTSSDDNKTKIAKSGALVPLTRLARSKDVRVQRNATGALLNMTHSGMSGIPINLRRFIFSVRREPTAAR
jgi:hypothetical protein